jgi:hypothetical protein
MLLTYFTGQIALDCLYEPSKTLNKPIFLVDLSHSKSIHVILAHQSALIFIEKLPHRTNYELFSHPVAHNDLNK